MKIIHTADIHLGNVFHRHTRVAEHRHFFRWLLDTLRTEQPDALIIGGDVFDGPNPGAEVQRVFYDFLTEAALENPGMQVVVIAGNHDSGARLEASEELLRLHRIYVRGTIRRTPDGSPDFDHYILPLSPRGSDTAAVVCFALPFLRPSDYETGLNTAEGIRFYLRHMEQRLKKSDFRSLPTVLAAHFYANGAAVNENEHSERLVVGGQDMVEVGSMGKTYGYVALGHIHRAQTVGGCDNVRYSGSPLALSFGERDYRRSVTLVDIDARGRTEIHTLPYTPLCTLLSIPERGALDPEELLRRIAALPEAAEEEDPATFPYLELNVKISRPEPELRHRISEALKGKAVRFCRVTSAAARDEREKETALPNIDRKLERLAPIDIARNHYRDLYGQEMPQALIERFAEAESSIDK